jgi:hypothetical protein
VAVYRSGAALRSRSVATQVHATTLAVPALPLRLAADWRRDIATQLCLEAGDVEPLSLARARARWPGYGLCVQALAGWMQSLGLAQVLGDAELSLMACRGARYHHDAAHYGAKAFCNVFVGEDRGLDLHFPSTGQRLELVRGTAVLFDTAQPHAVVARGSSGFDAADFAPGADCDQVFLSWELPIEDARVARALGIAFDTDRATAARSEEEQVWLDGAPVRVCPQTGQLL